MSTTANHPSQSHPAVLSAEVVLRQLMEVAILCRAAPLSANDTGTSVEGFPQRQDLKAVYHVSQVFSERFRSPCMVPVTCSSDPKILLVQQFAKLSPPSHKASPVSLLVPVQLSLFSMLLNGHVLASIPWLFPLEINHRVNSPRPKTEPCMMKAKVEKGFSDMQSNKRAGARKVERIGKCKYC